jgi:uncharacterized membrane protein
MTTCSSGSGPVTRRPDPWSARSAITALAAGAALIACGAPGAVTAYAAESDRGTLRLRVEERACQDVMSGEAFPAAVTLDVAGTGYRGCDRWLR